MRTKIILAIGISLVALALTYPVALALSTSTNSASSNANSSANVCSRYNKGFFGRGAYLASYNLSTGQTLTYTSTNGIFRVVSGGSGTGKASGTLTLQVTASFKSGYTLAVTSGQITLNGTTYTVSSGNAIMGIRLATMAGQGTLNNNGTFIFSGTAHGNLAGNEYNVLRFDLKVNGSEYVVLLMANVSTS